MVIPTSERKNKGLRPNLVVRSPANIKPMAWVIPTMMAQTEGSISVPEDWKISTE